MEQLIIISPKPFDRDYYFGHSYCDFFLQMQATIKAHVVGHIDCFITFKTTNIRERNFPYHSSHQVFTKCGIGSANSAPQNGGVFR